MTTAVDDEEDDIVDVDKKCECREVATKLQIFITLFPQ